MTTRQGEQNRSNHKENGDGGRSRTWFAANSAFILSAIAVLALGGVDTYRSHRTMAARVMTAR